MDSSGRKRRQSDFSREKELSKSHHHHSRKDDDRRRSDDDRHHRHREGSKDRESRRDRERSRSVERKKRKERAESEERGDKKVRVLEENGKQRRRFEDVNNENEAGSVANGLEREPTIAPSRISSEISVAHRNSPVTKVSSISQTNENKGVNSNRSHEVPGKSSTDRTASDAVKPAGLSLDALAKARKTLQMRKELAERMKKIPSLNRDAGLKREDSPEVRKMEAHNISSSSAKALLPVPVSSGVPAAVTQSTSVPSQTGLPHLPGLTVHEYEAVKRAQELAVKMGFRQDPEFAPLINMFPGQLATDIVIQPKPSRAPVLRLDPFGREVDDQGNVLNAPKVNTLSTLKVNINKQKKDAFQILKPELEVDPDKNPFFDARMGIDKDKLLRPKRMNFQFVEEGKWSKDAEAIKFKAQHGEAKARELRVRQAQMAKAKAEPDINPNMIEIGERVITAKEQPKESIPDVEWWDVPFLQSGAYGEILDGEITEGILKTEKMTIYVEHPRPIEPPAEAAPPPPQPLKLTKKEKKKLRTQRRLAREKDRQEMIRLGVLEPPKPKVKMSNLMKVLGTEATQDPTKLEMEIRSAAAEREQAHIDRNIARKLTPAERREKKERKLFEDNANTLDTIVSVYKINELSHNKARFQVDINAKENRLTGCAVISEDMTVVVVEGGAKPIKRYVKLMLKRIDWAAAVKRDEESDEDDDEKPVNKCLLVWQGSVAKPNFNRFYLHECRTEAAARKYFLDHGVGHYWDLAAKFTNDDDAI